MVIKANAASSSLSEGVSEGIVSGRSGAIARSILSDLAKAAFLSRLGGMMDGEYQFSY
jgi:hypothetical protein